jgi:hypothetical protein
MRPSLRNLVVSQFQISPKWRRQTLPGGWMRQRSVCCILRIAEMDKEISRVKRTTYKHKERWNAH